MDIFGTVMYDISACGKGTRCTRYNNMW